MRVLTWVVLSLAACTAAGCRVKSAPAGKEADVERAFLDLTGAAAREDVPAFWNRLSAATRRRFADRAARKHASSSSAADTPILLEMEDPPAARAEAVPGATPEDLAKARLRREFSSDRSKRQMRELKASKVELRGSVAVVVGIEADGDKWLFAMIEEEGRWVFDADESAKFREEERALNARR